MAGSSQGPPFFPIMDFCPHPHVCPSSHSAPVLAVSFSVARSRSLYPSVGQFLRQSSPYRARTWWLALGQSASFILRFFPLGDRSQRVLSDLSLLVVSISVSLGFFGLYYCPYFDYRVPRSIHQVFFRFFLCFRLCLQLYACTM